jgi:type II secretory pathway component PulF
MNSYKYQGRDKRGILVSGTVEANSELQASEILEAHGLIPVKFEQSAGGLDRISKFFENLLGVKAKDMVMFFRQLATLVNAQVRIINALRILSRQVTSKKLKGLIEEIASEVEGGKSLSDALSNYPRLFPELYTSLIRAGEASGTLDKSLLYLAEQIEKDYDLKVKVRGAMMYPAFIIVVLFIVGTLMMVFVMPQMTAVLTESGAELPFTTKIIVATSKFFVGYWYIVILAAVGSVVGFRVFTRTESGRYLFDSMLIKLPGVGGFLQKIYLYRFAHHLSNLLAGGISIVKSLQLISDIIGNWVYRDIFLEAVSEVQTGRSLRDVLEAYPEIPPLVYQMVEVGEQTGDLSGILSKLAIFYDKEVNNAIASLTTLIEPVIMVILGLGVGIMVAGILLPIYNLASSF